MSGDMNDEDYQDLRRKEAQISKTTQTPDDMVSGKKFSESTKGLRLVVKRTVIKEFNYYSNDKRRKKSETITEETFIDHPLVIQALESLFKKIR